MQRDGKVRTQHVERVDAETLKGAIRQNVSRGAKIMTDELSSYAGLDAEFRSHETVNHSAGEYARGRAHVNIAESFFALVKRGLYGAFHAVSRKHLPRYLAEFGFR